MAGFFKMMKRLNLNQMGIVTGSDFSNGKLPNAYLGKADDGSKDKLMIYGEKIEDFIFGKEDVGSAKIIQQEALFKMGNNKQKLGPKYEVKFKSGKTAIICIPANDAYKLEQIIY
ncbi:MAG: hypothetical protein J1G05_04060 [Clostridiales bacterium]|nr:hypothetical protein [Clostridiales bacterium]